VTPPASVLAITVDRPAVPGGRQPVAAALARIADALAGSVPAGSRVVRIGPVGVVALLPAVGLERAERLARAVRGSVADLTADGTGEAVTVSVGVAVASGPPGPADSCGSAVLWAADRALHAATRAGGDTVRVDGPRDHRDRDVPAPPRAAPHTRHRSPAP
jgi:GGDEF domain-containing protein